MLCRPRRRRSRPRRVSCATSAPTTLTLRFVTAGEVFSVFAVGQDRGETSSPRPMTLTAPPLSSPWTTGTIAPIFGSRHNARGDDVRREALGSKDSICVAVDDRVPLAFVKEGWTFPLPCPKPASWSGSTRRALMSWSCSLTPSPGGSRRLVRRRWPCRRSCLPRHASLRGAGAAPCGWPRSSGDGDRGPSGWGAHLVEGVPGLWLGPAVRHRDGAFARAGGRFWARLSTGPTACPMMRPWPRTMWPPNRCTEVRYE
jgi:hypothetical protein